MAGTVTTSRVLAAEWTKLTGLRSSLWVALSTVVAAAGLAWTLGLFDGRSAATAVVSGYPFAQLGAVVLGVLVGTGEYVTGTFRTTFTAVPRRLPVLVGQVAVTGVVALLTAAAALLVSLAVTVPGRAGLSLDDETLRVLGGFVLCLTGIALLGLGIGALVRRPTAALVTAVVLLVVVDQVLATNPGRLADTTRALLPGSASRLLLDDGRLAALEATDLGPHLGPWGSAAVLGVWVVALLVAAGYRLRRHDLA